MFVFEDVMLLDDRSMQRVLKEIDTKESVNGTKGCLRRASGEVLPQYVFACC